MAVSNVELRVDARNAVAALRNVNTATAGVTKSVGLLSTALKAIPFIGVADAARRFFKGFAEADNAAAAVRTLGVNSDNLKIQLAAVSAELKGQVGQTELLAASYDVASAGFNNAASAAQILKAASLGAKGGLSDLNTVADATTSVLNAYGLSSDKAAKLVDGFIQTQNDGKIVVAQYAQQIGRVAPIAAAAGVGIDELNAAISTVTATGVPVESTFAGLRQVIASVIKPTKEASDAAQTLGIDFSSAAIKTKGFGGFLEEVVQKTGGSEVALTKLFGSVEAIAAVLPLTNDGLVSFNKNLDNQAESAGAAEKAAKELGGTVTSQITNIVNNIGNIARALDSVLGPALKSIFTDVNNIITAMNTAISKFSDLTTGQLERASGSFQFFNRLLLGSSQGLENIKDAVNALNPSVATSTAQLDKMEGALNRASNAARLIGPNASKEMQDLALQVQGAVLSTKELIQKRRELLAAGGDTGGDDVKVDPLIAQLRARIEALLAAQDTKAVGSNQLSDAELLVQRLKAQKQTLEEQTQLAAALTSEQRRQIRLDIDLNNLEKLRTVENSDLVDQVKEATQALFDQQVQTENNIKTDKDKADALRKAQEEEKKRADELKNVYQGIGDTIADGVVDALKGAVQGTTTLAEAATNMLNDLANQLLQVARNMLFFGNLTGSLTKGGGILGSLFGGFMANGGTVTGGRSYVVGERGPELFTPGRTGSIAPSGSFSSSNIVVNVDASGSNVQGNAQQGKALGQAIGAAVQAELIKQKRPGGLLS